MKKNNSLAKEFIENNIVTKLRELIIKLDYPSPESCDVLKMFINAYNALVGSEDETKIGDIMDNQSLIDVMSMYKNFNARIISELYNSICGNKTTFFLYSNDIMINDIDLLDVSSIGEINSILSDNLSRITWEALQNPENPIFTPIYKIIFSIFFPK